MAKWNDRSVKAAECKTHTSNKVPKADSELAVIFRSFWSVCCSAVAMLLSYTLQILFVCTIVCGEMYWALASYIRFWNKNSRKHFVNHFFLSTDPERPQQNVNVNFEFITKTLSDSSELTHTYPTKVNSRNIIYSSLDCIAMQHSSLAFSSLILWKRKTWVHIPLHRIIEFLAKNVVSLVLGPISFNRMVECCV